MKRIILNMIITENKILMAKIILLTLLMMIRRNVYDDVDNSDYAGDAEILYKCCYTAMVTNCKCGHPGVTKFKCSHNVVHCTSKKTKNENGTDDEDGRQCELFALFTHWLLGSGERWYPSFTPFLVQLHDARKTYQTGRKGGEDISTTSKIGRSLIAIVAWDFEWICYDTSPTILLLNIPTVYRPILQFSPNCMDLKLVKSEDCAQ